MSKPSLRLLGGFTLTAADAAAVNKLGRKAQALLAYLAVNAGRACTREHLAVLLWPDRQEEQARQSLRQATASLRKALGPDAAAILVSDGNGLRLDPACLDVDIPAYAARLKSTSRDEVVAALESFRGDFLDQFGAVSEIFDTWCDRQRHELRLRTAEGLDRLTLSDDSWLACEAAAALARTLLDRDPLCEAGHRALIRHYGRTGQTSLAHRQFQICKETLKNELDIGPEQDTQMVLKAIRPGPHQPGEPEAAPGGERHRGTGVATGTALILAALFVILLVVSGGPDRGGPDAALSPASANPDGKSLAILPFRVIGHDRRADDFVVGLTESLTTGISMVSELSVISSGTALTYRNSRMAPRDIGAELEVRYVLEGSVQLGGPQVRVMASLLDIKTGGKAWSQLYERRADDIHLVQREIIRALLKELQVELTEGEQARIPIISETDNLEAWLLASRALQATRQLEPSELGKARLLYRQALALDPDYSSAISGLAWTHVGELIMGVADSPAESLAVIEKTATNILEQDSRQAAGHSLLAFASLMRGRHHEARKHGQRSVDLMPASADFRAFHALILIYSGNYDRAAALIREAVKLSPARHDWYLWALARAHRLAGRPQDALKSLNAAKHSGCGSPIYCVERTATLAALNRMEEAKDMARKVLAVHPNLSVARYLAAPPYRDPAVTAREAQLLRRAGLPE